MTIASNTTPGQILLVNDLAGTGDSPQLSATGVTAGSYSSTYNSSTNIFSGPTLIINSAGRIIFAQNGSVSGLFSTASSSTLGLCKIDGTTITSIGGVISAVFNTSVSSATSSTIGLIKPDNTSITISSGVLSVVTVPTSTVALGLAKPDNSTITISSGVISSVFTNATSSTVGLVKVDGTTITSSSGVISASAPPLATSSTLGIVKPGTNFTISSGVLSATNTYAAATSSTLGSVKVDGTTISAAVGLLSLIANPASSSIAGTVKPDGSTIIISSGIISLPTASSSVLGLAKVDGTTVTSASGVISAVQPIASSSVLGFIKAIGAFNFSPAGTLNLPATAIGTPGVAQPDNSTITISGNIISTNIISSAPSASTTISGLVKIGSNLNITSGVISLPTASSSVLGLTKVDGTTINVSSGIISLPICSSTTAGLVKPDGTTITLNGSNQLTYSGVTLSAQVWTGAQETMTNNRAISMAGTVGTYPMVIANFLGNIDVVSLSSYTTMTSLIVSPSTSDVIQIENLGVGNYAFGEFSTIAYFTNIPSSLTSITVPYGIEGSGTKTIAVPGGHSNISVEMLNSNSGNLISGQNATFTTAVNFF